MREWRDQAKRKKDSWTWTTVWGLLGGGDIRGLSDNGKNIIKKICVRAKGKNYSVVISGSIFSHLTYFTLQKQMYSVKKY